MPAELQRIARPVWPLLAGLALGLAIGGVWTLLQPDRYAAKAHVTLSGGPASRLAPAVETLANGSVVEQNVKQTLRLSSAPNLSASVDKNIVEIRAEAGSSERARQVDAEAAQVLTQLVTARFGGEGLQASLLDPAHVTDQTSPTPGRNLLICGLLGIVAGGGLAYARSRGRPAPTMGSGVVDPAVERRLNKRIDEVTKRERALARRAGELAASERTSEQRARELDAREQAIEKQGGELAGLKHSLGKQAAEVTGRAEIVEQQAAELVGRKEELEKQAVILAQTAEPPPAPEAEVPAEAVRPSGRWTLEILEHAVGKRREEFPEQAEEWDTYLFLLREHATIDGSLPRSFDLLIADVFADAL